VISLSIGHIAQIVNGTVVNADVSAPVTGVVVDSREISPGCMFVAIPGERADGHEFAEQAIGRGAAVVLAQHQLLVPCIVVPDTVIALGLLARHVRHQLVDCTVIAITGSSGKTSTKDLLASVLSAKGPTIAPIGSFNTEVGVPLTILRADESTRFLILEMGMRGIGHIAYLCAIASPEIGVLLNIGSAHLGMLGSRESVAQAKGEIIASLPAAGIAILNGDDPFVRLQEGSTHARVVLFGQDPALRVRASDIELDELARARFTLSIGAEQARVALLVHGEHFISNALAVAAVASELGLPIAEIAALLGKAQIESRWRMEISVTGQGAVIINDSYNANPESMRAALATLETMGRGRRTWAVLGQMLELGPESEDEHAAIGQRVAQLGVTSLICVGEGARAIGDAAASDVSHAVNVIFVEDPDAAIAVLRKEVRSGDIVLIKASRGVGLDRVAAVLTERDLA